MSARDMSMKSMEAVGNSDREKWLLLFADDAIVEDPIGISIFDPTGLGHYGKEEIAKFFDEAIAPNKKIEFEITASYECGQEVANVGTITTTLSNGQQVRVSGVYTYKINNAGKLIALRAFWEQDKVEFLS